MVNRFSFASSLLLVKINVLRRALALGRHRLPSSSPWGPTRSSPVVSSPSPSSTHYGITPHVILPDYILALALATWAQQNHQPADAHGHPPALGNQRHWPEMIRLSLDRRLRNTMLIVSDGAIFAGFTAPRASDGGRQRQRPNSGELP